MIPPPTTNSEKQASSNGIGYRYYDTPERPHVHTWDDAPLKGSSSVCKVIGKPLSWWASGKACEAMGWINSKKQIHGSYVYTPLEKRLARAKEVLDRLQGMAPKEYLALLDEAYRAHDKTKIDAGEAGTERHKVLEAYVKGCIADHGGKPVGIVTENEGLQQFILWAKQHIKRFLWSEMHGYNLELWVGGIADVGWEDLEGRIIGGDFKSSREAYFDQFVQVAGYDLILSANGGFTADGKHIFDLPGPIEGYCIVPFGQKVLDPELRYNVADYKKAFKSAAILYEIKNKHEDDE